jgi:hypothetical protein
VRRRLLLGVGVGHEVVTRRFGIPIGSPTRRMRGISLLGRCSPARAEHAGERTRSRSSSEPARTSPPPVLLASLGPLCHGRARGAALRRLGSPL